MSIKLVDYAVCMHNITADVLINGYPGRWAVTICSVVHESVPIQLVVNVEHCQIFTCWAVQSLSDSNFVYPGSGQVVDYYKEKMVHIKADQAQEAVAEQIRNAVGNWLSHRFNVRESG